MGTFVVVYLVLVVIVFFLFIFKLRQFNNASGTTDIVANVTLGMLEEGVIGINLENKIVLVNSEAERILNLSKKDLLGRNMSAIFPEVKAKSMSEIKTLRVHTTNEEIIRVRTSSVEFKDDDGKKIGAALIIKKTTDSESLSRQLQEKLKEIEVMNKRLAELKQNLEKEKQIIEEKVLESTRNLREEHTRLFTSIKNLNMGFIMTDHEKNFIVVNKTAKNMLSLPYMETSFNFQDIQRLTEDKIDFLQNLDDTIKNGSKFTYKDVILGKRYVNIFISPIILSKGKINDTIGAVILIEDKTEERLVEKSKENFFVIASHELRTPLTGIRGYIAIIKQFYFDSIKNEELKRIIGDIDISSTRLINIVNDFLDTTKIEQDKIAVHKEPCDLINIVKYCIKETMSIATEKKLYVNFNNSLDEAFVLGDKDRMKQIIINLLSNGLKYTERGGLTVNIDKEGNYYKISVEDTGKGIPEDNVKFLFSKYQQIDSNKRKNIVSTGLGLYISKILAEKMHGIIKLEKTEAQKGSTFSLAFPIYK